MNRPPLLAAAAVTALIALTAVVAPLTVVLGAKELTVVSILATGAWASVRRLGVADLSTAAAAGLGAYTGAVAPTLLGVQMGIGFVVGALTGALLTAGVAALTARAGRVLGALASIALGAATVTGLSATGAAGGAAGFHAVPLLTGSDEGDLVVLLALLTASTVAISRWSRSRLAAAASTSVRAPHVAESIGYRSVVTAAGGGAVAGAILGLGGVAGAVATGSVLPAAYDLSLAVAFALAALVGGGSAASGIVGAAVLWGPAVLWPSIGDVTLLGTGVFALGILAIRPQGLLPPVTTPLPSSRPAPPTPRRRPDDLPFGLRPREVLAVVGPNGAGKSTLLARIGGQLGGGAVRRARAGVGRTWQHPPDLVAGDGVVPAIRGPDDAAAAAWAEELLGDAASTPAGADLVRLAARRPGLALLDEPAAHIDPSVVVRYVRGLADGGAAVVVAEHRGDLVPAFDRTVRLGIDRAVGPTMPPPVATRGPAVLTIGDLEVGPREVALVDAETVADIRRGRATLDGRALPSRVDVQVRRGLVTVAADDAVAPDVSVGDHLAALGARDLLERAPLLAGRAQDPAGVLSGGERRMLSWLRAVAVRPRAVLLDRAGTGFDPTSLAWATEVVRAWTAAGIPVLVRAGRPEEAQWAAGTVGGDDRPDRC